MIQPTHVIPYRKLSKQPRIPAAELLHLPAPLTLFLEPTNICNFRCPICPESLPEFQRSSLRLDHWLGRILEQLKAWPPLKVMRFWLMGEPLLAVDTPEMIARVREAAPARIELATNASALTRDKAARLILSGLDYLRVSVYATSDEGYQKATGSGFTLSDIRRNVADLRNLRAKWGSERPYIYALFVARDPSEAECRTFYEQWQDIADDCGVDQLHNWGTSEFVQLAPPSSLKVCSKPFTELAVHADGTVSPCCVDWDKRLAVGHLENQTLQQIWTGEPLQRIRDMHLSGCRWALPHCATCTMPLRQKDDLDGFRGDLSPCP